MAKFAFRAVDNRRQAKVAGVEVATVTPARPTCALVERDLQPLERDREEEHPRSSRSPEEGVPRKEIMHFSRQLAVFMRAGIPILEALEVIDEEVARQALEEGPRRDGRSAAVG